MQLPCHGVLGVLGKCCKTQIEPTLTDPKLRTFKNVFGILDVAMRYTPWRAPGFAPVHDPCGTAGGLLPGQHSIANPEIQGGVWGLEYGEAGKGIN